MHILINEVRNEVLKCDSERKAHVYVCQWIDVARPHDGSYGVFDALLLLLGKCAFGHGGAF